MSPRYPSAYGIRSRHCTRHRKARHCVPTGAYIQCTLATAGDDFAKLAAAAADCRSVARHALCSLHRGPDDGQSRPLNLCAPYDCNRHHHKSKSGISTRRPNRPDFTIFSSSTSSMSAFWRLFGSASKKDGPKRSTVNSRLRAKCLSRPASLPHPPAEYLSTIHFQAELDYSRGKSPLRRNDAGMLPSSLAMRKDQKKDKKTPPLYEESQQHQIIQTHVHH